MRRSLIFAAILAAALATAALAQEVGEDELLRLPTSVIVLSDGEQIVIRGGYKVSDGLVLFYLDRGSHPVFASLLAEQVDFEATKAANERLRAEREREVRYWRLIEERQRRMLEEIESRPVVIGSQGVLTVTEGGETKAVVPSADATEFPPYDMNRLPAEPEAWWRDEAARLFAALDAANLAMAGLQRRHDELVQAVNKSRSESEVKPLREELQGVRKELLAARERARLVGNRLTDLSIAAEQLGKPIDWLLPTSATVIEESAGGGTPRGGEADAGEMEIPSYDAKELSGVEDSWWPRERARLEGAIRSARERLAALRSRYNDVMAERDAEVSESRKIKLTLQLEALDKSITDQNTRLSAANAAYNQLVAVARELGKEEALGLMKER